MKTENKDAKVIKKKHDRLQMRSHCSVCGNKKSRFVKKQEAKGILSSLVIKTPLSNIRGSNFLINFYQQVTNLCLNYI